MTEVSDRDLKKLGVIARNHIKMIGYKSVTDVFVPTFRDSKVCIRLMAKESLYIMEALTLDSLENELKWRLKYYCSHPIEFDMYFK